MVYANAWSFVFEMFAVYVSYEVLLLLFHYSLSLICQPNIWGHEAPHHYHCYYFVQRHLRCHVPRAPTRWRGHHPAGGRRRQLLRHRPRGS